MGDGWTYAWLGACVGENGTSYQFPRGTDHSIEMGPCHLRLPRADRGAGDVL